MFLSNLFTFKPKCAHDKITPDMEYGYCPDCGKLIKNEWYITRCCCCGVKIKAMSRNGEIVPQNRHCTNCGGEEYIVEKLDKISFLNVNFAVLIKTETESVSRPEYVTQCWQERTNSQPKLLGQYL